MKICILSMQRVNNFGSLLQSYALKTMLRQLGHQVAFLDIVPNREDNALLEGSVEDFSKECDAGKGILTKLKKLDRYAINRLRIKLADRRQLQKFQQFRENVLEIADNTDESRYDCCVIGSDEVFNCLSHTPWGFTGQLFGDVRQASRVITYAASCGGTTYEKLPKQAALRIREAFGHVTAFSVRDENTEAFVTALTEKPVQTHLDPALIMDFSKEIQGSSLPVGLPKRYCLVYSYYNRIHTPAEITQIQAFCKSHGLEPVTIGAPQMWISKHFAVTPFEALQVFAHAEFVITDTFHGTVFSAKYAKGFAVMVRPSNANKLQDLLARLQLKAHQVADFGQLDQAWDIKADTQRAHAIISSEYGRTMQYFTDSI